MSSQFTCNTCSLQFPSAEDQRTHMKSDWHRYNLKRRVANLPSIDEALFNEKVSKLSINESEDEPKEKKASLRQLTKKEQRKREKEELLEKKRQLLEIARQNMLNASRICDDSGNPIQREAPQTPALGEPEPIPEATEEAAPEQEEQLTEEQEIEKIMQEKLKNKVEIPKENCLFCNKNFGDFEANVDHMFKFHGFYIPEQKYLVDKVGLVKYIGEKIGVGNLCIVCDFQGRSVESARAHMLSKRHCQIPYHTEDEKLEISEFYDFSSTYGTTDVGNEEDWEDVEDGDIVGTDEEDEGEPPHQVSYDDGVELHLPSGIKIGNRALARYFKQNLKPEKVLSEGQGTIIAAESRHLATVQDRQELMEKKRTWKTEKSHQDRDDRRAAKFVNNQPYYRDQLLQ